MEHFPDGKQIGKILDIKNMQKRPQAQKHICWVWNMKKLGTRSQLLRIVKKYLKFAHGISVHHGSDAFPNELMRFRFEAKPIWGKTQKHCKMQS